MTAPTPDPAAFLTVEDVAREIGLHPVTVRKYIGDGKIPGMAFGGGKHVVYRIPRVQYDQWLAGTWQPRPAPPKPLDLIQHRKHIG